MKPSLPLTYSSPWPLSDLVDVGAVGGVGVETLLALRLGALAGRADVHHRQPGLLGEREGARVERVGELLVVLGDDAGAAAVGAVEFDQLDPEPLCDQRHRAVQLGGEAARDATWPVGELHTFSFSSRLGLDVLLAPDVDVEFLAVLLGVSVDRLDLVLGAVGQLRVDAGDQLGQRAGLAGLEGRGSRSGSSRAGP